MTGKGLCLWQGVTCHPHDDYGEKYDGDFYVAILNLTDSNVHGIVPREVFTGLEKMKALDLSKNELEGTIGEELGRLKDLEGECACSNAVLTIVARLLWGDEFYALWCGAEFLTGTLTACNTLFLIFCFYTSMRMMQISSFSTIISRGE